MKECEGYKMGLFDSIKKFANEIVDDEICPLGENLQNIELKKHFAHSLKNTMVSNLSTEDIEHKKIDNLREIFGVDYKDLLFFVDTTKIRNNGGLGVGATDEFIFWKFKDSMMPQRLSLQSMLCSYIGFGGLINIFPDLNGKVEFNDLYIDEYEEVFEVIISAIKKDESILESCQNIFSNVLKGSYSAIELEKLDHITFLNEEQHELLAERIIDAAITESDLQRLSYGAYKLKKRNEERFEDFRAKILVFIANTISDSDNLATYEMETALELLNDFDSKNEYTLEKLKLMLNLGKSNEAQLIAYLELPKEQGERFLVDSFKKDFDLINEIENSIDNESKEIFSENSEYANTYLNGGLLPVEYAALKAKPKGYIKYLLDMTDMSKPNLNIYGFKFSEIVARQNSIEYYNALVDVDDKRPRASIGSYVSKGGSAVYDKALEAQFYGGNMPSDSAIETSVEWKEKNKEKDRELERQKHEWDMKRRAQMLSGRKAFYLKLLKPRTIEENMDDVLIEKYLQDDIFQSGENTLQDYKQRLLEEKNNLLELLVSETYEAEPLEKGEFERTEDFNNRVNMKLEEIRADLSSRLPELQKDVERKLAKVDAATAIAKRKLKYLLSDESAEKLKWTIFKDQLQQVHVGKYDADESIFEYTYGEDAVTENIEVPIEIAQEFREKFSSDNFTDIMLSKPAPGEPDSKKITVEAKYNFNGEDYVFKIWSI